MLYGLSPQIPSSKAPCMSQSKWMDSPQGAEPKESGRSLGHIRKLGRLESKTVGFPYLLVPIPLDLSSTEQPFSRTPPMAACTSWGRRSHRG